MSAISRERLQPGTSKRNEGRRRRGRMVGSSAEYAVVPLAVASEIVLVDVNRHWPDAHAWPTVGETPWNLDALF